MSLFDRLGIPDTEEIDRRRREREEQRAAAERAAAQEAERNRPRTWGEAAKDTGIAVTRGLISGARALTDTMGPDDPFSKEARRAEENLSSWQSAPRQAQIAERNRKIEEADTTGNAWSGFSARMGRLVDAPVETIAEVLANMAPVAVGTMMTGGAGGVAIGAAQGAGAVKGSIYDRVRQEAMNKGMPEEEATVLATRAQSYSGDNQFQIALGAVLGGVAGRYGVEGAIARASARTAGEAGETVARRATAGATGEAATEFPQSAQEQYAGNVALDRAGFPTDPMKGVIGEGGFGAVVGGVLGGGIGAVTPGASPERAVDEIGRARTSDEAIDAAARAVGAEIPGLTTAVDRFLGKTPGVDPAAAATAETQGVIAQALQAQSEKAAAAAQEAAGAVAAPPTTSAPSAPLGAPPAGPAPAAGALGPGVAAGRVRADAEGAAGLLGKEAAPVDAAATPAAERQWADLTPMTPMQAQQRMAVLRDEEAAAGRDPGALTVVPHPTQAGAAAIMRQGMAGPAVPAAVERQRAAGEQAGLESAGLAGALDARRADDAPRQELIRRIMQAIESRGGVASPSEARALREANLGRPYDRIDPTLGPALSTDEQLSAATGIWLPNSSSRGVTRPGAPDEAGAAAAGETQARNESMAAQRERERAQAVAAREAADREALARETGRPPLLDLYAALTTPGPSRSAEQSITVNKALQTYDPADFELVVKAAERPFDLTAEERVRLDGLRRGPAGPQPQRKMSAPRPSSINGRPASSYSDADLEAVATNEALPAIVRRGAAIELEARRPAPAPTQAAPATAPAADRAAAPEPTAETDGPLPGWKKIDEASLPEAATTDTATTGRPRGTLTRPVLAGLRQIARLAGKKVEVVEGGTDDGFVVPGERPDTIYLNRSSSVNAVPVFMHELFHQIAREMPAAFDSILAALKPGITPEKLAQFRDYYGDEKIADAGLMEEMAADLFGQFASADENFWTDVFAQMESRLGEAEAKTMAQKLGEIIKRVVTRMVAALRGSGFDRTSEIVGEVEGLRDAYVKALADYFAAKRDDTIQNRNEGGSDERTDGARASTGRDGDAVEDRRVAGGAGVRPSYGEPREGAIEVVGRHYSRAERSSLNAAYYGTGLKGGERNRLAQATDRRIQSRIYFYVDAGKGFRPESGVGGVAHEVTLRNIYDPATRLIPPQPDSNAFESAVIDAGFDGYIAPFATMRAVVLLGPKHSNVPVVKVDATRSTARKTTDDLTMKTERTERKVAKTAEISIGERERIEESAKKLGVDPEGIAQVVMKHKRAHPESAGWATLTFKRAVPKKGSKTGALEYEYENVPYSFDRNDKDKGLVPGTPEYAGRVDKLAKGMLKEVIEVKKRADAGDVVAKNILDQAGWYKNMRARLRHEFGGLGDVFADLLGATSPNTPVRDNWFNAVDALRRATRGDFDELMPRWEAWVDAVDAAETDLRAWYNERLAEGATKKAIESTDEYIAKLADLKAKRKFPDDLLPTKETGANYGFNGKNVVRALVDLWRVVRNADPDIDRGPTAPKAINFSGNLIGFRERATIDVWAARMLNRLADRPRVPSMAETGVTGAVREDGSTTGQFGMGQDVFTRAAGMIRTSSATKGDPLLASLNDDDLQAVVWFVEKEVWTRNNWTSVAGEGGSFELEANLTGSNQQAQIKELRRIADSSKSSAAQKADARAALVALERTVDRFVGGLSVQQSAETQGADFVPSDVDMARVSAEIREAIYALDDGATVLASKVASTEGRYGGVERSFDIEVVAREGFDMSALARRVFETAREAKQDSAFVARVLRDGEMPDALRHRPGVEVYFRESGQIEQLQPVLDALAAEGLAFYTVIVDGRRTPASLSGAMPNTVGVRMMYLPEFDARYGDAEFLNGSDADLADMIGRKSVELHNLARQIVERVPGVTFAGRFWYDVDVRFAHEYEGAIDALSGGLPSQGGRAVGSAAWAGRSVRQAAEAAVARDGGIVSLPGAAAADDGGRLEVPAAPEPDLELIENPPEKNDPADFRASRAREPQKTVTAYKLFRIDPKRPGKLFPLFVNADKEVPLGQWLAAEEGPRDGTGVKSKLGRLAYRPGWHAGDLPIATHIGAKSDPKLKKPDTRPPTHVWAEVQMAADVDWQKVADARVERTKDGRPKAGTAHITDQIPRRGFYRYKTNPNMTGNWLIGGDMKVVRVLAPDEVEAINRAAGVADLPRRESVDLSPFGVRASRERAPGFKSKMAEAFEGAKMGAMPGSAWKAWLNSNASKLGLKADEIEFSGIREYLDLNAKNRLSKDELAAWANTSGVIVGETSYLEEPMIFATSDDIKSADGVPKFKSYRRPGAIEGTYRETLLSLFVPVSGKGIQNLQERIAKSRRLLDEEYPGWESGPVSPDLDEAFQDEYAELTRLERVLKDRQSRGENVYRSDHWDTPNVLVHLRTDVRASAPIEGGDGESNSVLFVNEIQSDWAQQAREEGFRGDPQNQPVSDEEMAEINRRTEEASRSLRAAANVLDELRDQARNLRYDIADLTEQFDSVDEALLTDEMREHFRSNIEPMRRDLEALEKRIERAEEIRDEVQNEYWAASRAQRDAEAREFRGVARAPFISDTKAWVALAVKRAIRMAADMGVPYVAFTNGSQAAQNFSLDQQVEWVDLERAGPDIDSYKIVAKVKGGERVEHSDIPAAQVGRYIGQELADSMIAELGTSMKKVRRSGGDLKMGGEGMRGFYDGIVPQVVRDVVKKLGGKTTTLKVRTLGREGRPRYIDIAKWRGIEGLANINRWWNDLTLTQQNAEMEAYIAARDGMELTDQLAIEITPEMRQRALDGMPLFSRQRATFDAPVATPLTLPSRTVRGRTIGGQTLGDRDSIIFNLQDKMIDTKRVVQQIEAKVGQLSDDRDPYLREELYYGRTAKRTKDFLDLELRPLLQEMQKRGVSIKEFEEFLHNRHAEERNRQIAKINPEFPDGGSGIDTADARAYLAALGPKRDVLEALATRVDAITAGTRQSLIDDGLEEPSTIGRWMGAYKSYVPLYREEMDTGNLGTGRGFGSRGTFSKRAMGSDKPVADILANLAMQRERAIVRGEKARVGRAVYGLAIKQPHSGFWLPVNPDDFPAYTPEQKRNLAAELISLGLDPIDADGLVNEPTERVVAMVGGQEQVVSRINARLRSMPNVFPVRVNGKDRFVFFNERDERAMRMASTLNNIDAQSLGKVLGIAGMGARWFAQVNTQWNPIFGVVNLLRDTQGALFNLSTTPIAGKQREVMAQTLQALRGIYADIRAHRRGEVPRSKWAGLWEQFQKDGGQTGFRDMWKDAEDRTRELEREIRSASQGKARSFPKAIFDWLSDYNETLENAVRLAAYKTALDSGMSRDRAASVAKNLTVNFNRKGQVALQAGALYAFFNASVQGTARLYETLTGPAGKKIIAGGLALGVMQALMLAVAGFDDEEPPQFIRERNLVIPVGGGKYVTIPMPLGLHLIPNMGRITTEWALSGFRRPADRVVQMTGMFLEAFNPIGNAGWSIQTIAPTIVDPLVALAENRDWQGRPIALENMNPMQPKAGHLRTRDTASEFSKILSYWLNAASGGTEFSPGVLSPTPDQIDYLLGQIGGGVAREIIKAQQTATAAVTGEEVAPYKIPLAGRFFGDSESSSSERARYLDNMKEVMRHNVEMNGRRDAGQPVGPYILANPDARLVPLAKQTDRIVDKLRDQKRALIQRGAPADAVRAIDERIKEQMRRFNERVAEMQG